MKQKGKIKISGLINRYVPEYQKQIDAIKTGKKEEEKKKEEKKEEKKEDVLKFAKEIEKTAQYCYEVDLEYNGIIKKQHFYIVDSYRELWCNGCEEPLLAVKNLPVKKSDISLRGSILKIYANNTTFIKYKTTEEEYKKIVANGFFDTLDFTIVGRFSINEYGGNRYPQVIIEAYDYKIKDNLTINNFFD